MLKPINSQVIESAAPKAAPIKLTKRTVESLKPGPEPVVRYDDRLSGFGVRVMPSGRRFYFVRYRNKYNRSRWFSIGEHGKITADIARSTAQRVLQAVVVNESDPSGERESFRSAPTVSDLFDRYIAEHVEKKTDRSPAKSSSASSSATCGQNSASIRSRLSPGRITTVCTARGQQRLVKPTLSWRSVRGLSISLSCGECAAMSSHIRRSTKSQRGDPRGAIASDGKAAAGQSHRNKRSSIVADWLCRRIAAF